MQYPRKKSFAAELLEKRQKKSPAIIAIAVIAVIIAICAIGYALYMHFGIKEIPPTEETLIKKPSIAVLPFVNMSDDETQEYFCDGMAEEIINALTNVGGLRVIARTSTFVFKDKQKDIAEIGRKLNVETVLEGSVRKVDNQLRITAQLINVADESHLWSEAYNRELEDVFAIQEEISLSIVDALKVKLLKGEKAAIEKHLTEDTEAYDLYMMGRHFTRRYNLSKALDYQLQAVEKDSSFAAAYAEIAFILASRGRGEMASVEAYINAKKALDKAFELDDMLPGAYLAQAYISMYYEWDWRTAEDNFKKAIDIDPGYMTTYMEIDNLLTLLGKEQEMLELQRKALEIDPLSLGVMVDMFSISGLLGDYEQAEQIFHKIVEIDSTFWESYYRGGLMYAAWGKYEEAITTFKKYSQLIGYPWPNPFTGYVYGLMGKRAEAEKMLADLQAEYPGAVYYANLIRLGLKDYNPIFEWFENLYNERSPVLPMNLLRYKRWSKDIVSDPRWKALMKKMGLPE